MFYARYVTLTVVYDPCCFGVITTRHDSCFGHDIKNTINIEEHYIGDEDNKQLIMGSSHRNGVYV
jgi:hypothetical protein